MGARQSNLGNGADPSAIWKPLTGSLANDVEALKSGSETDASRRRTIETAIQSRVAAEVKRLQSESAESARQTRAQLLAESSLSSEPANPSSSSSSSSPPEDKDQTGPSTAVTSARMADMRARLDARINRLERQVPPEVEAARQDVVRCLLEQDRRPLNCYQEVDLFKHAVESLERKWVEERWVERTPS